ncbi:MAG: protein kinase [Planctomycetes bacterium]|nr:protein kinase [Planctomycetota bacterium]
MNDADVRILAILEKTKLFSDVELDKYVQKYQQSDSADFLCFLLDAGILSHMEKDVSDTEDSSKPEKIETLDDDDGFTPAKSKETLMNIARITPKTVFSADTTQQAKSDTQTASEDESKKDLLVSDYLKDKFEIESSIHLEQPDSDDTVLELKKGDSLGDTTVTAELLGKHVVTGEIGRGGMGAVLSVFDHDLQRELAAKVILTGRQASKLELQKFLIEAQITGQLEHPNIVPVHEINISEDKRIYFTMKYVRGRSLQQILRNERKLLQESPGNSRTKFWELEKKGDVLSLTEKMNIFVKICDAMAFSHSKGVIHRDLKPANIMVGEFGEVQVMDWGLAKVIGVDDTSENSVRLNLNKGDIATKVHDNIHSEPIITMDGRVIGTPAYMPPEQADGEIQIIDERSDIYSLGVILYEMITYSLPFEGKTAWEIVGMVTSIAPILPSVKAEETGMPIPPRELEAITLKAMSKSQSERYQTVNSLKSEISRFLHGFTVGAAQYSSWQILVKWVQRNKTLVTAAAAVFLIAVILASISFINISNALDSEKNQRKIAEQEKQNADIAKIIAENEKQKALESEAGTRKALKESQNNLSIAYAKASESALKEGNIPAATLFASNSLAIRENDTARNIYLNHKNHPFSIINQHWHKHPVTLARYNADSSILLTIAKNAYLWDSQGNLISKLKHDDEISYAVFTPDGLRILTASWFVKDKCWSKTLKIWSLAGDLVSELNHESFVGLINFSSDGQTLLTSTFEFDKQTGVLTKGLDGIKIWNFDGLLLKTIVPTDENNDFAKSEISDANFSIDNKHILTNSYKSGKLNNNPVSRICVHDFEGEELMSIANDEFIYSAEFMGTKYHIFTISYNYALGKGFVRIYSIDGLEQLKINVDTNYLSTDVSRDGNLFVMNNLKKHTATVFETNGNIIAELEHENAVKDCYFINNGKTVVSSTETDVFVWNIENKTKIVLKHLTPITSFVTSPSSSKNQFTQKIAVTIFNKLYIWEASGTLLCSVEMPFDIKSVFFTDYGNGFVVVSDVVAYHWDIRRSYTDILEHNESIQSIKHSRLQNQLLTYSSNNRDVFLWTFNGQQLNRSETSNSIFGFVTNTDLYYTSEGQKLHLRNSQNKLKATLNHVGNLVFVDTNPVNSKVLVSIENSDSAYLWDIETQKYVHVKSTISEYTPRFSNTGKYIIAESTSERNKVLTIYNLHGEKVDEIIVGDIELKTVRFSPDDKHLITIDYNGHINCWSLINEISFVFEIEHGNSINLVEIAGDSSKIFVSSYGMSRIYDFMGKQLASIKHDGEISKACFSKDNLSILAAGKEIALYNLQGDKLIEFKNSIDHIYVVEAKFIDSNTIFTATNSTITLWNTHGSLVYNIQMKNAIWHADIDYKSGRIFSASGANVHIWKFRESGNNILLKQRYKSGFVIKDMKLTPEIRLKISSKLQDYIAFYSQNFDEISEPMKNVFSELSKGNVSSKMFEDLESAVLQHDKPSEYYLYLCMKFNSMKRANVLKLFLTEAIEGKLDNNMKFGTQTSPSVDKYEVLKLVIESCKTEAMFDNVRTQRIDEKRIKLEQIAAKAKELLKESRSGSILEILLHP